MTVKISLFVASFRLDCVSLDFISDDCFGLMILIVSNTDF